MSDGTDISAIDVAAAGKRYTKYQDTPTLIGRAIQLRGRTKRSDLWAIRDASFSIGKGECVGVIGQNGSGKSTLLRMLAGVTAPTEGRVAVNGRVAPLIAVGVGFHRELTGLENIYVNGIVLGRTKAEMDARLEEILAFSEIGQFIDTPVKFYSSGMFVRLGFAVSIMVEPDILIVDEVLAVGDLAFQMKCFDRMSQLREAGTTIVLVSHSMRAVQRLCPRTLVAHQGTVRYDGDTSEAIGVYHDLLGESRDPEEAGGSFEGGRVDPSAEVESFELRGPDGRPTRHVTAGDEITAELSVRFVRAARDAPLAGLNVFAEGGVLVYANSTPWGSELKGYEAGARARFTARFRVRLAPGSYTIRLGLMTATNILLTPSVRPLLFYVDGSPMVKGFADLDASFTASTSPERTESVEAGTAQSSRLTGRLHERTAQEPHDGGRTSR